VSREDILRDARIAVEQDAASLYPESDAALHVVTLDEFADADEPGAAAILGTTDAALIPEGGDVMTYGDGGVGKTTLMVDLGVHLAAGDDWLGLPIPRPRRVLLVENEGPRPLFRRKLQRKRDGWKGGELRDRILVLERPWGQLRFTDDEWKQRLADVVREREIDVVIVGPLTSSGMDAAGTLQEARDFIAHVDRVRELSERPSPSSSSTTRTRAAKCPARGKASATRCSTSSNKDTVLSGSTSKRRVGRPSNTRRRCNSHGPMGTASTSPSKSQAAPSAHGMTSAPTSSRMAAADGSKWSKRCPGGRNTSVGAATKCSSLARSSTPVRASDSRFGIATTPPARPSR
jgi:hypothetical protein